MLLISLLFVTTSLANGQEPAGFEASPLYISSLNTSFGIRGEFTGEYQIYPDSIKVTLSRSFITVSENCPYKGRRYVDSIQVGLANCIEGQKWDVTSWSKEHLIEKVMKPGERYELGELELVIPKERQADLGNHWLVIQIEDITLDVPVAKIGSGYDYAHSDKQIFNRHNNRK
jgi:hypothetical protein